MSPASTAACWAARWAIRWATPWNSTKIDAIRATYGPEGLRDFTALDGGSHFSDDTQMTLYTVDGLLEALEWANSGVAADTNACLWLAYLRWLGSQGVPLPDSAPFQPPRWIDGHDVLRHRRAPGNACLSGLATGEMGTVYRPVNPESKGCGTVMRSAPFGLIPLRPGGRGLQDECGRGVADPRAPRGPAERRRVQPADPCAGQRQGPA